MDTVCLILETGELEATMILPVLIATFSVVTSRRVDQNYTIQGIFSLSIICSLNRILISLNVVTVFINRIIIISLHIVPVRQNPFVYPRG